MEKENTTDIRKTGSVPRSPSMILTRAKALWAFSEASFGGVLHLLKFPFKGLLLSGTAVILIRLIHLFQKSKDEIFKTTLEVLAIKGMMSPHTPVNAYFAVIIEGASGQFLFNKLRSDKLASVLLALFAGIYSALQKIVVLTLLFGLTLWESIDSFTHFTLTTVFGLQNVSFSLSGFLISLYLLIHLIGAGYFGLAASKFGDWVTKETESFEFTLPAKESEKVKEKRKSRFKFPNKLTTIFLTALLILSYFNPSWKSNALTDVLIMTVRGIVLTFLWYSLLSPITKKILNGLIEKRKSDYLEEVENILKLFPQFKSILNYSKKESKKFKGVKRIKEFFKLVILTSLIAK